MEELLQDIFKEASGAKLANLRKTCQDALEILCIQESSSRKPCYEVRRACLLPLQMSLESKRSKLVNFAINGFHKILRDDRFHQGIEPEDDSLWMPSQLLCATSSVMYQLPDTQVQIFRMYLSLALSPRRTLNGRLAVWACGRCSEAAAAPAHVAAAARAAAAQTLRAYCAQLDEECQELMSEGSPIGKNHIVALGCYSEIIPVIQYLCGRLSETQSIPKQNPTSLFFLDCLLTLMTSLSERVCHNPHFTTFLWQKFCPSLISFLGTPRVDKNIKSREHEGQLVDDSGRGSGALSCAPSFNSKQAKAVYSIANQLVRLVGSTSNLRPVVEALYHRMLLYPPVSHRVEPLRSVRDLLHNPRRLCQLILLKKVENGVERHGDDMAIVRLIMDGIEECGRSGDPEVITAAVECTVSLLDALERMCTENLELIPAETVAVILEHWPKIQDSDYSGPLTYQHLARLPSPYRDVVAVLQSNEDKEDDSSDTSGPENNESISEAEPDSDNDNVFLPSRPSPNNVESDTSTENPIKSIPKTLNLGRCNVTECNVDLERHNARQFVKTLQNTLLPKLLHLRTCIEKTKDKSKVVDMSSKNVIGEEIVHDAIKSYNRHLSAKKQKRKLKKLKHFATNVDEAMQEFASKCCQHNAAQPPTSSTIMNADGIYLATYAALLLNLKLSRLNYYKEPLKVHVPQTEDQFVQAVQDSGVLVYLSGTWLRELYQTVLASDLLAEHAAHPNRLAVLHLLSDLGGLEQSPVMSDWQKLKEVSMLYQNSVDSPQKQAHLRWARRILTCIWESMVTVLSVPLTGYRNKRLPGVLRNKISGLGKRKRAAWEALTISCLEGLHKAARVSNTLDLQNRCSSILALLANSAISQPPNGKILSTHALSLDILISGGLELGSKAPECWEHIFGACQYVSSFEHSLFGQQGNNATPIVTMQTSRNKTVSMLHSDVGKIGKFGDSKDDETCVDVFNYLQPSYDSNQNNEMSVAKIVEVCRQEGGMVISGSGAARVCCALSAAAEALFSRLAATSTLPTLINALQRLVRLHNKLLFKPQDTAMERSWFNSAATRTRRRSGEATRALCRAGDVALRCVRAARPLAHRMAVWTVVGPHFMQAACHKDLQISSLGIQCLHDCCTALLNHQPELPHFHFNEALLKPFENLLCLELCDADIQEQIISCICEFVETNRMEIRSGWRPLFNTLRAANNSSQYAAILEIFKVFLSTDNTLVFANAALDCILCLLSHIKGLHYEEPQQTEVKTKKSPAKPKPNINLKFAKHSKFIPINEEKSEKVIVDMCKEALYHLESCADILTMMNNMPKCPVFNTGNRIKGDMPLSVVDPIISSCNLDITKYVANENCNEEVMSYRKLSTSLPPTNTTNNCLLKLDKPNNILKVWYVLIEGLISATVVCSKKNQPATMETLFKLLNNIIEVPGTHFGLHCINHLLLPTIQNWLRQVTNTNSHWDNVMPNFKQCCGMTTDTIVVYLHHVQQLNADRDAADEKINEDDFELIENAEVTFALKQLLLILVECIAQPQEPIARLGASCVRHIILTSGHLLTDNQWAIVCTSLHRACNVSLTPLKQLTYAFQENSDSFYGDLAIVKVAARRDCSVNDNVRLHAMAQQVFSNDQTKGEHKLISKNSTQNLMLIDDRSYVFLIYLQETINSLNPELYTVRIPHRSLVVGLLAHQILVQIIATVLIQASSDVFRGINSILLDNIKNGGNACNFKFFINSENVDILLKSLELSYSRAIQFDIRPGLKFLVQKVSNLDYAANLYKQTTSSWLIKIIALSDIFFNGVLKFKLDSENISVILHTYVTNLNNTLEYDRFVGKIFDLKATWELICNSYVKHLINISDFDNDERVRKLSCSSEETDSSNNYDAYYTQNIHETDITSEIKQEIEETEKPKPFTFADFKMSACEPISDEIEEFDIEEMKPNTIRFNSTTSSTDSDEDNVKKVDTCTHNEKELSNSKNIKDIKVDDEVNGNVKEKNPIKVVETSKSIEVNKARNVNITICDKSANNDNLKNKNIELLIPPQPVPPEIEQQRALSITKDTELQRNCFLNIILAYLELILTFPEERFKLINPVLRIGFLQLSKTITDQQLLDRINIFFDKKDLS